MIIVTTLPLVRTIACKHYADHAARLMTKIMFPLYSLCVRALLQ